MPAAAMKNMLWTWFCVLAAVLPGTTAIETKSVTAATRQHSVAALVGKIPAPKQDLEYEALRGERGGLRVLEAKKSGDDKLYRPWKTRFDLQPFDTSSPDFYKKPENRMGYRHFYEANPNLALTPNSRDRKAQSTVEMMFGLTALATIVVGLILMNRFELLDADKLDIQSYQTLMIRVITLAAVPWLVLGAWLLTVFFTGWANPMRDSRMSFHWQCNAMAWFLIVAPLVNTAYFAIHALWISKLFFSIEAQPTGAMGRMFSPSNTKDIGEKMMLNDVLNIATSSGCRYLLLLLEFLCGVLGYLLITFRGGANSQLCQPEVYWATTALVITVAIVIVFTGLTLICSILIGVYSTSPWLQDFMGSFREARLLEKMKKEEVQEQCAWKSQLQLDKATRPFEEDRDEWKESFMEDHKRHNAILAEHANYLEAVSFSPPRHPQEKDKPLVVWDDDEEEAEAEIRVTSDGRPQSGQAVFTPAWSGQPGFVAPFLGRANSMPVITTSQGLMTDTGRMPATVSSTTYHGMPAQVTTIYKPPTFVNSV